MGSAAVFPILDGGCRASVHSGMEEVGAHWLCFAAVWRCAPRAVGLLGAHPMAVLSEAGCPSQSPAIPMHPAAFDPDPAPCGLQGWLGSDVFTTITISLPRGGKNR